VVIGLNFSGDVGLGKNTRNTRSYSRDSEFFVTWVAGVSEGAVRATGVAREGLAATGTAMVELGGSVIVPRRLS